MLTKYLALVSDTPQVPFGIVSQIAAALQKQITRDFTPIWQIPATIAAFEKIEDVPSDYWPIIIKDDIGYPRAAGIHLDSNGQPFSLVQSSGVVSLTCCHEAIEMLADPFGNRFVAGDSVIQGQGRVNYLVEICDPCEGQQFSYSINGLFVSDFYTPSYFDPTSNSATRYSFSGSITEPRQVLSDGYLSWMIPDTNEWWQRTFFDGVQEDKNLGVLNRGAGQSWREVIDGNTFQPVNRQMKLSIADVHTIQAVSSRLSVNAAAIGHSRQLRKDIDSVIANAKNPR